MKNSRQYNSSLNIIAIYGSKILQIVLTFCMRRILIVHLGEEILGIDGLFASILSVLSLADLGINTAIIYALYAPIARQQEKKIAALVSFFKRVYMIVGISIFVVGICSFPFLKLIINFDNDVQNVGIYYILTIISTSASYFCSSRRVIFEADQMNRVVISVDTFVNIFRQLGQLIIIWIFGNYFIVLVFRIIMSVVDNLVIYYLGDKKYPYLVKYRNEKLSIDEKTYLFKNTGAVLCHKIGGVIVNSTDSIIISSFVGTVVAGYYSNYMTVLNGVAFFVTSVFTAITPSIGNLKVDNDDIEKQYHIFEEVFLTNYILSCFCVSCLFSLLNLFITIWLGKKFIFSSWVVVLICINFYLTTIRYGVGSFCTAGGLFKDTLIKPIIESIVNLIVSIWLVNAIGISGVIIGTIVSLVCGSLWVDPYFLLKKWFKKSLVSYFTRFIIMFLLTFFISFLTYYISSSIQGLNVLSFIIKAFVVVILSFLGAIISSSFFPGFNGILQRLLKLKNRKTI